VSIPSGARLGSYEILSTLGAGGMGVVYRAFDSRLQRTVALKVLGDEVADETARHRLLHEARAASALSHPHICVIYEVGEAESRTFIAMEYVDGRPLSQLIPVSGLPADQVIRYAIQIADALVHAHDRGVVHRDLKSANIIISTDHRAKVVDFGLARRVAQRAPEVSTASNVFAADSALAGTLNYMAPEVLRGEPPSAGSDIWAFGVLLHEMCSGTLPFSGRTSFDLTAAILGGAASPLPAHVPASLRLIVSQCLARELGERYRAAGEVRAALQAVRSDSVMPISAALPVTAHRRRPWVVGSLVVSMLALAGTGVVLLNRRSIEPPVASTTSSGRLVLLVGSDRQAYDPALSPDGKMIAYVAEGDAGRVDLVVSRVAGGGRVALTSDQAVEGHPRFSPDGERILFDRRRPDADVPELCVVPALGGDVAVVLTGAVEAVWSPDGSRIAFIRVEGGGRRGALVTTRSDGSDARILLPADGTYPFSRHPTWARDGKTLAVVRGTGGVAGEIWLLSAEGAGLRRLSNDPTAVFSDEPVFSTDGRRVIYSSNRGGATNIWSLPVDGGEPVRLTTGPGPEASPSVAMTGEMAFVSSRWRNALIAHDLNGRRTRTLLTHSPFLWAPSFSPNGRELAFSRGEVDGAWHLWLVPVDGGSARQLVSGARGEVYPRYTPDGQFVTYHTWDRPHRVWRVPLRGGPPVALTPPDLDAAFGDVSPDGMNLAFVVSDEKQGERVYRDRVGAGKPTLLTASPASVPRWSPDGRWIAFSSDRGFGGGIFIVRPDGTDERRLTKTGGWPIWWPDSRRIGYRTVTADARQQIETVRLDGSPAAPIEFRYEGANEPFDISPDGRTMATTNAVHVSDEIWLMDRNAER
jgi:Tol biopolymer transport system component/tRNA A-37 threonylcarbamoyl transferase component Bud32